MDNCMIGYLPAVCYFPSTVVLIDDNHSFLKSIVPGLSKDRAKYKIFNRPQSALRFLNEEYNKNSFVNRCLLRSDEEQLEHRTIDINVRAIHEECYNSQRFDEISVLIVDYSMPGMNGLELCKEIKDKSYKKILLTCEADESIAIKAFNEGIIDCFIRKHDQNLIKAIDAAVHELQKKYFHDLSMLVAMGLSMRGDNEMASMFLSDKVFIDFFDEVMQKINATEYYLMDISGSFMFLDVNGNPCWLVVKNEDEMSEFVSFAKDDNAPLDVIDPLIRRNKIPYFHADEELQTLPRNWEKFLHSAQRLKGNNEYFYSLITDSKAYSIRKISSFADNFL